VKAVILDGAHKDDAGAADVLQVLRRELSERGWEAEHLQLEDMKIADCRGDFLCWTKSPGICAIDDAGRDVAKTAILCDLLVLFTPVTFGGYSSVLKKGIDHLIQNISPFFAQIGGETHHQKRYDRYPRLLGVGLLPERDEESERIFATLIERNAINMTAPAQAAGVISRASGTGDVLATMRGLLDRVEVRK